MQNEAKEGSNNKIGVDETLDLKQHSKKRKQAVISQDNTISLQLAETPTKILRVVKPTKQLVSVATAETLSLSHPATSASNHSVANSLDKPPKPKSKKRKASKIYRTTLRRIRKQRKKKRIRLLSKINPQSDFSTGYCSTALDSMNLSDTSSSSSGSGIEGDVESLGHRSASDEES